MLAWDAGFAGGMHDRVANLIMAAPSVGWGDLRVINGDIVVKDGTLQTLNLQVLDPPHQCSSVTPIMKHARKYPILLSPSTSRKSCQEDTWNIYRQLKDECNWTSLRQQFLTRAKLSAEQ